MLSKGIIVIVIIIVIIIILIIIIIIIIIIMIIIHLIAYSQARGRSERRRCLARKTSSCAKRLYASAYTLHHKYS